MNILEQKRKDNLARNELMLRNLVGGAAKDLASTVEAEKESEQKVEQPERGKAYKDRLAEQALQGGRRRSSKRAATVAATRKIADSFAGDVYQEEAAAGSDDESEDMAEEDEDEEDAQEDESEAASDSDHNSESDSEIEAVGLQSAGKQAGSTAANTQPRNRAAPIVVEGDEDSDIQIAVELSMQEDSTTKLGVRKAGTVAKAKASNKAGNNSKSGRRQKRGLAVDLSKDDVDSMFDFIAGGKVTLGAAEFVSVVNRLGLDIDDDMVGAAFDHLHESPFAGPCNRVDKAAFRAFVEHLSGM